jgi:hypothetical protein
VNPQNPALNSFELPILWPLSEETHLDTKRSNKGKDQSSFLPRSLTQEDLSIGVRNLSIERHLKVTGFSM